MGSHFAQNTTPTPVLYSAITHPFGGYVPTFVHKTPPTPPQNIPFPGLNWKEGRMNYHLGKMRPQLLVYVWKVDKALLIASLNLSIIHWSMSKNRVTNTVKAADVKTRVSAQISIKQHSHFSCCAQKLGNKCWYGNKWLWIDHNQSFEPELLQMKCDVWRQCRNQHWWALIFNCRVLLWAYSAACLWPAQIRVNVNAALLQSTCQWMLCRMSRAAPQCQNSSTQGHCLLGTLRRGVLLQTWQGACIGGHSWGAGTECVRVACSTAWASVVLLPDAGPLGWTGSADGCIWRVHSHAAALNTTCSFRENHSQRRRRSAARPATSASHISGEGEEEGLLIRRGSWLDGWWGA